MRELVDDPDVELMLLAKQDFPGSFQQIIERYWTRVFGRFVRQFGDRQEAEDLAQDVFLRLYRSRKRYRPTARLSTWVFIIARNVGRNAIRRRRRRALLPIGLPFDANGSLLDQIDDAIGPGWPAELAELSGVVRLAIATLSDRQRRAVELQCESHSYAEIATELRMSPKAAKSLLYRARNELRDVLSAYANA